MGVLLRWTECCDGGLTAARTNEKLQGRSCFARLGEVGHFENQEKVQELKETTFLLLVN